MNSLSTETIFLEFVETNPEIASKSTNDREFENPNARVWCRSCFIFLCILTAHANSHAASSIERAFKGHSQLAQVRILYHFIANLHI